MWKSDTNDWYTMCTKRARDEAYAAQLLIARRRAVKLCPAPY